MDAPAFWTYFTDVKTSVHALTETLALGDAKPEDSSPVAMETRKRRQRRSCCWGGFQFLSLSKLCKNKGSSGAVHLRPNPTTPPARDRMSSVPVWSYHGL